MTFNGVRIKRLLFRTSTAVVSVLLTFAIGVAISPIRFRLDLIAHGKVLDGGGRFVEERFTSSYFIKLWFSSAGYASPEKADQVFRDTLKGAVRVIERTPKLDCHGHMVGERAVVILMDREHRQEYATVFWTEGGILRSVESSSLTHVLEFEKDRNGE